MQSTLKPTCSQQTKNDLRQQLYRQMMILSFIIGLACSLFAYETISGKKIIDNSNMNSIEFNQQNDVHMTEHYPKEIQIKIWFTANGESDCDVEVGVKPKSNYVNH